MRILPVLIAAMVFTAPALAEKPTPDVSVTFEADTYRYGDLYRSERGTTVEDCSLMCSRDSSCASWTLTPATFRLGPRCELKRTPGAASHRPGAASGMSEYWQMDAGRHADMRYQPRVPESRQPAAVPLEQLRPSPVPRVFGDPPPVREPELMGGPKTRVSAVMRRPEPVGPTQPEIIMVPAQTAALSPATEPAAPPQRLAPPKAPIAPKQVAVTAQSPVPAPKQAVEILRGPGQGETPKYVKQPAPETPHPLYGTPTRSAEPPKAQTVFRDPSRNDAVELPLKADYNAVLKRESQVITVQPAAAPAPSAPVKPVQLRRPWTDRDGTAPDYSVGGTKYVPGDEDATAGYVEGAPEAGT